MYAEIAFVKSTKRFKAVLTKYSVKTREDSDTLVNSCFENNKL